MTCRRAELDLSPLSNPTWQCSGCGLVAGSCRRIVTKPQHPSDDPFISGGQTVPVTPVVFESCHSTWVFDTEHMRFRRILRGIEVHDHAVVTEWRRYFGLEMSDDSEAFTVFLNPE